MEETRTIVMLNQRDEDGLMLRVIGLDPKGQLIVSGHDIGPGVERFFGMEQYEFERTYSAAETLQVCELLAVPDVDQLLEAIQQRFASTRELEAHLAEHGLEGDFWSRVGD